MQTRVIQKHDIEKDIAELNSKYSESLKDKNNIERQLSKLENNKKRLLDENNLIKVNHSLSRKIISTSLASRQYF